MKVWIDGRVVAGDAARLPVTDHGLLYGDGVFEGIRVYGRRVFRLDDHLERLAVSARAIGLTLPLERDALRDVVLTTARAYGEADAYVRLIVTRGDGALGVDPTTCKEPRVICIVDEVRIYPESKRLHGIDLVTVSWRRPALDALDPRVKSLNYLNSVLAKLEARERGADEALILNAAGSVAEAAVANVFAVRAGVLRTPPPTDGALEGITRRSVLELAASLGIPAFEASLARVDLLAADEVFLTGTGARLVAVRSLDGQAIGAGGVGPVTRQIEEAYDALVEQLGTPL
ncbi:MAG: branched-chain-amino-acid transaminase [Deltaproteobacteria bacterium]|nr:MAG: branched-chain-amino-acid transaminase [Deltaproteobacteria bacterium]